ncbi:SDR family NAD(P)-dependent oxidoreductase [Terriglobus saanensis]|uniref:Short-chain dehydrogenase/reductase SDR n=1 Tax=Terriglobus saanensis (strain ATCC BAA-1853 / DSM 23119 / SP1PR4) TaxID=401053 RepID=E8V781_TERSS|nr:SDR family oxidoreductase [Terriglobus saanensis]ADV82794.1 short-chain dehydrogenase/reductase SDR [Terriglobus saanensis SP1PR4]
MRLRNKVALITGGNNGIGLATAKRFVSEGAKVSITGRDQKALDTASVELGPDHLATQVDVTDYPAMEKMIQATVERFGRLDVIFANAGIASITPLGATSVVAFEEVLRVNLTSVFFLIQAALPHLREGASIIFNSSYLTLGGLPGTSSYVACKAALRGMARVMGAELSPRKIRVNVITTGPIDTQVWSILASTPEEMSGLHQKLAKTVPLGRMGLPVEIANTALFLASDESSFIQGTEIVVDGGVTSSPLGAPIYH